ncbi:hypothetical protein PITCH_A890027 [uncultured Desulfobacterium sp.]|uniref:Uncharacterized protein n=1 Tax=uncultured Desulfobacterium sp. TaxID=201089 RepID=A0A445N3N9_9BACT|nr:hypothetical protein PITCH_A890027 [uncultured Desulfobacterium sp.]
MPINKSLHLLGLFYRPTASVCFYIFIGYFIELENKIKVVCGITPVLSSSWF